jgi:glucose/arabinose dehydrogenase
VGIGSTGDASAKGRLSGTVVSFAPHGRHVRVEARGLRNPYGLDFIPGTGELLVSDNGRDQLGPTRPPDELDVIDPAGPALSFGFPDCYDQGGPACQGSEPPVARLPAHAAAGGLAVARRWGRDRLSAFVAEFGSSFPTHPTGDVVDQVLLRRVHGRWRTHRRRFADGFAGAAPLGVALGPGRALYVTLWRTGTVVRFDPPRVG